MRFTDLSKHPVVDLSTATTVAQLGDVAIDPATGQVLGFGLRKAVGGNDWLPWSAVHALGTDAATVDGEAAFAPLPEGTRLLKHSGALGRRVLSTEGVEVGELADVELDPDTGVVTALVLEDGSVLPAEALLGVGGYATVVRTAVPAGPA